MYLFFSWKAAWNPNMPRPEWVQPARWLFVNLCWDGPRPLGRMTDEKSWERRFVGGNAAQNDPQLSDRWKKTAYTICPICFLIERRQILGGLHSFCARWQKVHPMTCWQLEAYGWPYHRDRLVDTTGGDHFWTLDVSDMTPEAPIASPSLSKSLRSMGIGLVGRGGDLRSLWPIHVILLWGSWWCESKVTLSSWLFHSSHSWRQFISFFFATRE